VDAFSVFCCNYFVDIDNMKTTTAKLTEIRNLNTGSDYIFKVEKWITAGGGVLYSFRVVNHYGEMVSDGNWLLSQGMVDSLKRLFDWED
jgi:hypothetical protein